MIGESLRERKRELTGKKQIPMNRCTSEKLLFGYTKLCLIGINEYIVKVYLFKLMRPHSD